MLVLTFSFTNAAVLEAGEEKMISEPVNEDLYISAGKIQINAPVYGDLIAAGGNVRINDSVESDLLVTGGDIDINGVIGDDARVAGGIIRFRRDVRGDVFVGGGEIYFNEAITIRGDLVIFGGKITVNGNVLGDLIIYGGEVTLNGDVSGLTRVRGGEVAMGGTFNGPVSISAEEINLGDQASFSKDISYWQKDGELDFGQRLKGGTAMYDDSLRISGSEIGTAFFLFFIFRILAASLMIVVIVFLFNKYNSLIIHEIKKDYGRALGYGFLYFLGIPVLALALIITVIGIPLSGILALLYVLSLLFAHILVAVGLSYYLMDLKQAQWGRGRLILISIGMFILIKIIAWIPFVGWLINFGLILLLFGGFLVYWRNLREGSAGVAATG